MASYYDDYTYYSEPDYYGGPNTYQEPDNNYVQPDTYYSEEPQYYEDSPDSHASLEPTDNEPHDYEDAPDCHTGLEPVDDENWPTYEAPVLNLPRYEDLHPMYQDPVEGLGDYAAEEHRDGEGHGWCDEPNESIEYPPHPPSLDNISFSVLAPWVNPDPNHELSLEEWDILVAQQNTADDAIVDKLERELEEFFAVFNSMNPLEQEELESRMNLLAVGDDVDDRLTFYPRFLNAVSLMAVEKPSSLRSLDTMALLPPSECPSHSQNHIDSTVSRPPRKTCPQQYIYSVTVTPKLHSHFRTRNQPTQHRHPPHNRSPPSQPYTPRQRRFSDSRTKPHRKHPPNRNLPIKAVLDMGSNARRRISQKAALLSRR